MSTRQHDIMDSSTKVSTVSRRVSTSLLFSPPPPLNKIMDEYNRYINTSSNSEIEDILNQLSERRSAVKKEIFIKGKQKSLKDFISFMVNIVIFARYWVKMEDNASNHPTVLQMIIELANYISTSDYKSFHDTHSAAKNTRRILWSHMFSISLRFLLKWPRIVRGLFY